MSANARSFPARGFRRSRLAAALLVAIPVPVAAVTSTPATSTPATSAPATSAPVAAAPAAAAPARPPADLAGVWDLSFDKSGASCRIQLRADRSDRGDYFLGMPTACRHAMPGLATVGRWAPTGDGGLTLDDPAGTAVLTLESVGDGFVLAAAAGTYTMRPAERPTERQSAGAAPPASPPAPDAATTGRPIPVATLAPAGPAAEAPVARKARVEAPPTEAEIAGRYAVMRDKRDTGCMVTLDRSRARDGGERAQLAPGCRDQGIVVFDPSAWSLARGALVLTARAGHKTRLERGEDGVWAKDAKEGGKPLGLKKL